MKNFAVFPWDVSVGSGESSNNRAVVSAASATFSTRSSATFGRCAAPGSQRIITRMEEAKTDSCPLQPPVEWSDDVVSLNHRLEQETWERQRAECKAEIQSHAVQLTLDLLVQEPDRDSFFRELMHSLLDHAESHTCAVWLLDEDQKECELWMAYIEDRFYSRDAGDWGDLALPREEMKTHLVEFTPGWSETIEYGVDDPRLPESVREFNRSIGLATLAVVPLKLATRNLGWIAM